MINQKWDQVCADGETWKAPRRQMDLDRMNNRRRRGRRAGRFLLRYEPALMLFLAILPALVALALGWR